MGQETLDLRSSHVLGVLLAMKQDIAPDPAAVGRLGADGVVFSPDGVPDLVEQFSGRSFHGGPPFSSNDVHAYMNIRLTECQPLNTYPLDVLSYVKLFRTFESHTAPGPDSWGLAIDG
jgi:hypothetical protein